jgi:transposase
MNEQMVSDAYTLSPSLMESIAREVGEILAQRMSKKEVLKLLNVVFLDVEEAAELLRVKPKTISMWISRKEATGIPVRYAGGRPVFLLAELLLWTLPEDDHADRHRLSLASSCTIAANRLATNRERRIPDVG